MHTKMHFLVHVVKISICRVTYNVAPLAIAEVISLLAQEGIHGADHLQIGASWEVKYR